MAHIKLLTENCICTFDTVHHGLDQSKPHSIGFLKEKLGVHTLSFPSIFMVCSIFLLVLALAFVQALSKLCKNICYQDFYEDF